MKTHTLWASRLPVYHPAANLVLVAWPAQVPGTGGEGFGKRFWQTGSPGLPDDFPSPHTSGKPIEALAWVGGLGDRVGGPGTAGAGAVQVRLLDQKAESPGGEIRAGHQGMGWGCWVRQAPRSLGLCLQTGLRASGALANPQSGARPCGMEGRMI